MFRNGVSAGRRSVRVSACIPTPAAPSSKLGRGAITPLSLSRPEIPFVCLSCQVRTYAAKPRKTPSPLIASIKRLEQHVQLLEARYDEQMKQDAVVEEYPALELTEDLQDEAYAALMAPESNIPTFLPVPPAVLPQLPRRIVARLGTSLAVVERETNPIWDPIIQEIQEHGGFKGLGINEVNKTLHMMSGRQRARLTDKILSMVQEAGLSINVITYDLLMMAHAAVGNVEIVKGLYERLKESKLVPSLRIYGHLLKALSQTKDMAAASTAFQEMHAAGIKPNLIVYTSLIKTCINREELDTAWQIFDLIKLRSTETAPDVNTYSLMIHACSMRGEAEKALDLFRHMTQIRGLEPDEKVYNSLIHACAVRKDYFLEAWKYATEMRSKGMKVARWTLNHLLQACGKSGDLTRARLLMRLMMSSGNSDFQPDERSFQGLFRAYATALVVYSPTRLKKTSNNADFLLPNSNKKNEIGSIDQTEIDRLPFLQDSVLASRREILAEAKQLLQYIMKYKPDFYSTRILNAYLDVCYMQYGHNELQRIYFDYYAPIDTSQIENEFADADYAPPASTSKNPDDSDSSPKPIIEDQHPQLVKPFRNIFTFEVALEYARRAGALKFAHKVWADRMQYCATSEYWSLLQPIRRRLDFTAEKLMLQTLAKADKLDEAIARLKVLQYEYDWRKEDLKLVYDKAREMEDMGAVLEIRKVLKLEDRRY